MQNSLKAELSRLEEEQVRSNIERIISSYRHVWDIYTELLQNSADAILEQFGEENIESGFIKLEIDTSQHQLSITDNGIGILEDEMSKILVTGKSLIVILSSIVDMLLEAEILELAILFTILNKN